VWPSAYAPPFPEYPRIADFFLLLLIEILHSVLRKKQVAMVHKANFDFAILLILHFDPQVFLTRCFFNKTEIFFILPFLVYANLIV